jgi:Serine/threonine protein kinase
MRDISEKAFELEFEVYRDLTPEKRFFKTLAANRLQPDGAVLTVVLKEIDEKRIPIYELLAREWNPYIAEIYEVLRVASDDGTKPCRYYAVVEYVCAKGDFEKGTLSLSQYMKKNGPLSEKQAMLLAIQICEGLKQVHQGGLIHRDIKPDNIMMACCFPDSLRIKIIDFGGGKQYNPCIPADTTVVGTLGYQAPESLSSNTTARADVYSIGCLLNFMLTGHEPGVAMYKGRHELVSLIEKATFIDPYARYSSVDLMERWLRHILGERRIDRIPVLREIPGFRTAKAWKEILSVWGYLLILISFIGTWEEDKNAAVLAVIMFLLPVIVIGNPGNIMRFLPKWCRQSAARLVLVKSVLIFLGLFIISLLVI